MEEDKWWYESVPQELPYTIASLPFRRETDMAITEDSRSGTIFIDLIIFNDI